MGSVESRPGQERRVLRTPGGGIRRVPGRDQLRTSVGDGQLQGDRRPEEPVAGRGRNRCDHLQFRRSGATRKLQDNDGDQSGKRRLLEASGRNRSQVGAEGFLPLVSSAQVLH